MGEFSEARGGGRRQDASVEEPDRPGPLSGGYLETCVVPDP